MEQLLQQMFEIVKKQKQQLSALKNLAVKCQQFEIASKINEIEKELFPETDEEKKAKEKKKKEEAKKLRHVFRMVFAKRAGRLFVEGE